MIVYLLMDSCDDQPICVYENKSDCEKENNGDTYIIEIIMVKGIK